MAYYRCSPEVSKAHQENIHKDKVASTTWRRWAKKYGGMPIYTQSVDGTHRCTGIVVYGPRGADKPPTVNEEKQFRKPSRMTATKDGIGWSFVPRAGSQADKECNKLPRRDCIAALCQLINFDLASAMLVGMLGGGLEIATAAKDGIVYIKIGGKAIKTLVGAERISDIEAEPIFAEAKRKTKAKKKVKS